MLVELELGTISCITVGPPKHSESNNASANSLTSESSAEKIIQTSDLFDGLSSMNSRSIKNIEETGTSKSGTVSTSLTDEVVSVRDKM